MAIITVSDVCYVMTKAACQLQTARSIIRILRHLTALLAPNAHCLTSIHADMLQACIAGQMYGVALRFLDSQDIRDFDTARTHITSQDCMRYFYYAGIW